MLLLIIGPRYSVRSSVGGVVVLFEMLLKELVSNKVKHRIIDSNLHSYSNMPLGLFSIYINILSKFYRSTHVSIHAQNKDFIFFIPLLVVLNKIGDKKLSMRKFAGDFKEYYEAANVFVRWLIRFSLKNCDVCFFETKYLVNYFKQFNADTYWFPNVRDKVGELCKNHGEFNKKFVFVGQVKETKGVMDLVNVFRSLPESYVLDVYGPLDIDNFEKNLGGYTNINYKGPLEPHLVAKAMAEYDVFAMPTFHPGEGYPGVIIEAFSVGLPVIVTCLDGIKEIVSDGESGILVEPRNLEQIKNAVLFFDKDNYQQFSEAAKKSFEQFDSEVVTNEFLSKIGAIEHERLRG